MKKLIVLSLVLAMGVVSNASIIELRPTEGGFTFFNTTGQSWDVFFGVTTGASVTSAVFAPEDLGTNRTLSFLGTFPWAGTIEPSIIGTNNADTWQVGVSDTAGLMPIDDAFIVLTDLPAGAYWTANPGALDVLAIAEIGTIADGSLGALYAVPEPATMVLLGLGALVLRKRK